MTRGAAVHEPDGPATTSGRTMKDSHHVNGLLPASELTQRKQMSRHTRPSASRPLPADVHMDTAGQQLHYLVKPDGRRFPLPPGLTPEQRDLARQSPFLDLDCPMTPYEWFKLILYIPVLLMRLILILILMPPCWLFSRLITAGMHPNQPFPEWRKAAVRRFVKIWARVLLFLGMSFYTLPVKGREHIAEAEKARAMITINHVSYVDALALGQVFVPCGLAKASVVHIPCFGSFALMMQFLFVERRGTDDAAHSKSQKGSVTSLIHNRNADARFPLFLMMPEGTTKGDSCLLPFSSGAFAFGSPVLPVLMRYNSKRFNLGWGSVQSVLFHILRMQAQFVNRLEIEVLPVYYPSPEEKADAKLYAENVRRYMAGKLGASLSTHGMDKHSELKKARLCVDWTGRKIIQLPPKAARSKKAAAAENNCEGVVSEAE